MCGGGGRGGTYRLRLHLNRCLNCFAGHASIRKRHQTPRTVIRFDFSYPSAYKHLSDCAVLTENRSQICIVIKTIQLMQPLDKDDAMGIILILRLLNPRVDDADCSSLKSNLPNRLAQALPCRKFSQLFLPVPLMHEGNLQVVSVFGNCELLLEGSDFPRVLCTKLY